MRKSRTTRGVIALALALAASVLGPPPAPGDTYRMKTDRGTYLVEAEGPDSSAKVEGDELIITRGADEFRIKLDASRAEVSSKTPLLTVRRDGKVIAWARRLADAPAVPASPMAGGPGRTVLNPRALAAAWNLAATPDGKTWFSGHQGSLRAWDPATLAERYSVPVDKTVRRISVTPDGSTMATAEFSYIQGKAIGHVVIRDGKTGQVRRTMKPVESLHTVSIDPAGKVVASGCWGEADIRIWDVESGEQVGTLNGAGAICTVVFSPDGKTLASGGFDGAIRLWDADTGEARKVLRGHHRGVESLAFGADGKTLASGGHDDDARAWDLETGKCLATFECENPVLNVAITPDGKTLATASARWGDGFYGRAPASVKTWDVATGKALVDLPEQPAQVFALLFKPDGKALITGNLAGAVTLWDLTAFPPAEDPSKPRQPANR